MHRYSSYTLLIVVCIMISAYASLSSKSPTTGDRTCPEEYRELSLRDDEEGLDAYDEEDKGIAQDESRESRCEQAMNLIIKLRRAKEVNPSVLLHFCPHYGERLALAQQGNDTLCEEKKQELIMKRKRQGLEKKGAGGFGDSDGDHKKRWQLHRQEVSKRSALKFLRKRML